MCARAVRLTSSDYVTRDVPWFVHLYLHCGVATKHTHTHRALPGRVSRSVNICSTHTHTSARRAHSQAIWTLNSLRENTNIYRRRFLVPSLLHCTLPLHSLFPSSSLMVQSLYFFSLSISNSNHRLIHVKQISITQKFTNPWRFTM